MNSWKSVREFLFLSGVMNGVFVKTLSTQPISMAFTLNVDDPESPQNPLLIVTVYKDSATKKCSLSYNYQVHGVICSNQTSKPFAITTLSSIIGVIVNDAMME